MTHICLSKLTFNGSDNDLAPGRREVIIWTNDVMLLAERVGTYFIEIFIIFYIFFQENVFEIVVR